VSKAGFGLTPPRNGISGATITCSECGTVGSVSTKSVAAAHADQWLAHRFQQRGWKVGSSRRKDVCPDCQVRLRQKPEPIPAEEPQVIVPCSSIFESDELEREIDLVVNPPTTPTTTETPMLDTPAPTKRAVKRLGFADRLAIHNLLAAHLTKRDDGFWEYAEEWGDTKIAEAVGNGATESHVKEHRQEHYGKLQRGGLAPGQERLAAIEKRLADLEEVVLKLTVK
jgi:hypothetical protein